MTKFIETCKPFGYDENLHKSNLYFPYNILAIKDDRQYDFKQLIKNTINLIVDVFITLCKGYFYLFLLGSVVNMLTTNTYVFRLTLCALVILIISNKIKDKVS